MVTKAFLLGICLMAAIVAAADSDTEAPSSSAVSSGHLSDGSDLMRFIKKEWDNFRTKHKRTYSTLLEAGKRFKIFVQNIRSILRHNQLFRQGNVTFEQHTNNPFADLTPAEFLRQRTISVNWFDEAKRNRSSEEDPDQSQEPNLEGQSHNLEGQSPNLGVQSLKLGGQSLKLGGQSPNLGGQSPNLGSQSPNLGDKSPILGAEAPLPWAINWVELGAVTPVVDQGDCGSCWAFTMTGAMEGWHWRKTGQLVPLSQQQVLDCTGGDNGCDGGWPPNAFEYARMNYGLSPASAYPYRGEKGYCYNVYRVATIKSFAETVSGSELDLMRAVALYGPVTAGFLVNESFQFYSGGVYQEARCTRNQLNHGLLVVGYGYDEASQMYYWLVKNSWGPEWGENGYARIKRYAQGAENCNIALYGVYATS